MFAWSFFGQLAVRMIQKGDFLLHFGCQVLRDMGTGYYLKEYKELSLGESSRVRMTAQLPGFREIASLS